MLEVDKDSTTKERILHFVDRHKLLITFLLIETLFFGLNYKQVSFYDYGDLQVLEAHPFANLARTFTMWQQSLGFGLELGSNSGLVIPLLFFSFLSSIGLSATQVALVGNFLLFTLPGLSAYVFASAVFYKNPKRQFIAFLAGLLYVTSFGFYLMAIFPLLGNIWAGIWIPILLSDILMILRTGEKKYWLLLLVLSYVNLTSFVGFANAAVPVMFALIYLAYYLGFESLTKTTELRRLLISGLIVLVLSSPLLVALLHLEFFSTFTANPGLLSYDAGVFQLNLHGLDYSSLLYSIRLIGQGVWSQTLPSGSLYHAYYALFTYNPLFVVSSFLLPVLAFATLFIRDGTVSTKKRVFVLALSSLLLLFLIKGVREPFGWIFLYLMQHVNTFIIFTNPYDKVAPTLTLCMATLGGYGLCRLFVLARQRRSIVAKVVSAVVIVALVVNSYPMFSGEVLSPMGFFHIPGFYSQAAGTIDSNQSSFGILPIPGVAYSNCYSWGYCGINIDGFNFAHPVVIYSYAGSDVYNTRMIDATLSEVGFDVSTGTQIMDWSQSASIFPNTNVASATINVDRTEYFSYLLRMSNIGVLVFHHDSLGGFGSPLSSLDRQRYNQTLATMINLGAIQSIGSSGNLTSYRVTGAMPTLYARSTSGAYETNSYDNFLNSYYVDSALHSLSSFFNYNANTTFVTAPNPSFNVFKSRNLSLGASQIYAPFPANQYANQVQNEISTLQGELIPNRTALSQLTNIENTLGTLPPSSYIDNIMKAGNFSVYMRISSNMVQNSTGIVYVNETPMKPSQSRSVGSNNWYLLGHIDLPKGLVILKTAQPTAGFLLLSKDRTGGRDQPKVSFQRLDSSAYSVTIQNATGPFWLDFAQSFSDGWKVYPMKSTGVFDSTLLTGFSQQAYPSAEHFLLNGYANAWYIDKSNLDPSVVNSSKNGSWNLQLLLYYSPQSYFDLAWIASLTIAALLAMALILPTMLRRGKILSKSQLPTNRQVQT
jgi:hypothetical protein